MFSPSFLASIGGLSIDVRPAPPRVAQGAHQSPRIGDSVEFRDYQQYTVGDDLRRVDWSIYARTRHLFVRRYEHPTAVPIFILVDASESMRLETPSRYESAARIAAAIASAGLASHNPVYLTIADGKGAAHPQVVTGRQGLVRVLTELAAQRSPGGAGIAADIEATVPLLATKGRGVMVIVSDFFEKAGADVLLRALRCSTHRLLLVRVTQPWDANPTMDGDVELLDCESDKKLFVSIDAKVLNQYRNSYQSYFSLIDSWAAGRGAIQKIVDASHETLAQLARIFPGGVLQV